MRVGPQSQQSGAAAAGLCIFLLRHDALTLGRSRVCRSFEDVAEAAKPDGQFGGRRNNSTITHEAFFSLSHRCGNLTEQ